MRPRHIVLGEEHGSTLGWREAITVDVPVAEGQETEPTVSVTVTLKSSGGYFPGLEDLN